MDAAAEEVAAGLAVRFEGCVLHPYLDSVGKPTIGYGATYYEDGRAVALGDPPITKERAIQLLDWMNRNVYVPGTKTLCPTLSGKELGATSDFSFNCGLSRLKASTLRRKINAGEWDQVPTELAKWCRGGGRVLRGLVLRRAAEAAYFDGRQNSRSD